MFKVPSDQLVALMKAEITEPEMVSVLNTIRDYDPKIVGKFRKEDMTKLSQYGFIFSTQNLTNQREEIRSFLLAHPSCMGPDVDTIARNFYIYSKLLIEEGIEGPLKTLTFTVELEEG